MRAGVMSSAAAPAFAAADRPRHADEGSHQRGRAAPAVVEMRRPGGRRDPDDQEPVRLKWPLTGRAEEMRLIEAVLWDPDLCGVVIHGAAGIGKSRIAREALSFAATKGSETRWAVATSSSQKIPLGAFAHWAGSAIGDTLQLVGSVIESLIAASAGSQVAIGVDDVNLLDDTSIFVLHQIVQRRAAKLILTVRDREPVGAGMRELWKAGQFERLDLRPLSPDGTTELLLATLGGGVDLDAARRLWKLTCGNVLYLRNIVEQEIADGRIAEEQGRWCWHGDPVVPPDLVELIESRIGVLPASVSDVVDVLAVGEPIELGSLTRITDPAAVEEADVRGLLTLDQVDGRVEVRVAHPLYAEVRKRRAAPTRLRRLRGLVVAELVTAGRADVRAIVRQAVLSLDSDLELDADLLTRAAQGAVWLMDLPLADRLACAAIRAGGGPAANFLRAYVLSSLSRGEEADAVLADMPISELGDGERATLANLRATNRLFTLADPEGAKRLIDDASRSIPAQACSCLNAFLTVYWAAMGHPDAATNASKNVVPEQLSDVALRFTAWARTVAAGDAGRTSEAAAAASAGYPVAVRGFVIITDAHVGALLLAGQIAEATAAAKWLRQRACNVSGPGHLHSAPVAARAALGAGRLDTACALLEPIIDTLVGSGERNGWGYRCQIPHTIALAMRGSTNEAIAAFARLEQQRHPAWRYLDYEYELACAWVAACQGAVNSAITTARSAARLARTNGQFAAEVMCLQTAVQFGDQSSAPRLRGLESIVEGPRAGVAARFAEALHAGNAAVLASVSQEFERMGDLVVALDAAAHAAIAYRRQDKRGSALGCSTRAEALAEQCGGAVTPALRQAAERVPVTTREREVAMLLGEGMSNRQIAARLTLSIRTVENHIYKAMAKTGTASREDLAAVMRRRSPKHR